MTKCGAINRGDTPRLIPTHEVRKSPICLSKSIDITLPDWSIIPRDGHSYTRHPIGCFVFKGK